MSNFLTANNMIAIQELLSHLNCSFANDQLHADVVIGDSNGEIVGRLEQGSDTHGYVFAY